MALICIMCTEKFKLMVYYGEKMLTVYAVLASIASLCDTIPAGFQRVFQLLNYAVKLYRQQVKAVLIVSLPLL